MKKMVILVLLLLAALLPSQPVYAGIASHNNGSVTDSIPLELLTGTLFGFDISGLIVPIVDNPKENTIPDVHPYSVFNSLISTWARPMVVQKKTVDYTNANPVSAKYCVKIVLKPPYMDKIVKYALTEDTTEISQDWEEARIAGQHEEILASWNGLWKKTPSVGGPLNDAALDQKSNAAPVAGTASPDGFYNYNYATHTIASISTADCSGQDPSTDVLPEKLDVVQLASLPGGCQGDNCAQAPNGFTYTGPTFEDPIYGFINGIKQIIGYIIRKVNFPIQIQIWAKHGDSSFANLQAKSGRCNPGDTKDEQTAKLCEENGQWTTGFVPISQQKPVEPHALQNQKISLNGEGAKGVTIPIAYKNTNSAEEDTQTAACFNTPLVAIEQNNLQIGDAQSSHSFRENCNIAPLPQCPIDIIKEQAKPPKDNACRLANMGSASSFMLGPDKDHPDYPDQKKAYGDGLSPLAIKILETAADTYKVPASLLFGTMLHEGAFNHPGVWNWSDDKAIEAYSDCHVSMPMPKCESFALPSTGSKAPLGFIDSWWDKYMENNKNPYDGKYFKVELEGMSDVLKNMKPEQFNSCNFADAVFMAARAISEDASHPISDVPAICHAPPPYGDIPMFLGDYRPESCSSWTADRVATARFQYGGGASIGTCTPEDPANSYNIGHIIDIWNALTP